MNKCPLSIRIVACLFIMMGAIGFLYHLKEFNFPGPLEYFWVLSLRLLAIMGGVFLFRGRNWARWLLVGWLAYHAVLSFFHPRTELGIHVLFLLIITYLLFRPSVAPYFVGAKTRYSKY